LEWDLLIRELLDISKFNNYPIYYLKPREFHIAALLDEADFIRGPEEDLELIPKISVDAFRPITT